eukprot:gnl/MRDRNA2_/MRDRNA2_74138_c0_seq1.p1 gnl/MRDRNA2_/MRDRNA2_74138_c0~~gnl/MRDRNA2_/MRDRNA2_74138_c0_seq1.p1  ORF type:complete len:156 (-),score=11.17 gnl/MRDRNA2_/MRDRNA2_74138_c0_seq1:122-589(-)
MLFACSFPPGLAKPPSPLAMPSICAVTHCGFASFADNVQGDSWIQLTVANAHAIFAMFYISSYAERRSIAFPSAMNKDISAMRVAANAHAVLANSTVLKSLVRCPVACVITENSNALAKPATATAQTVLARLCAFKSSAYRANALAPAENNAMSV